MDPIPGPWTPPRREPARRRLLAPALALALAAGASAGAGPPLAADAATLKTLVEKGDWTQAAEVARRLERAVAERAPLEIVDLKVLGTPPEGLGMYTEPLDARVRGPEIYVYAQVRNHALRTAAGFHELHLVTDLVLLDASGQELARDLRLGESHFNARAEHRDTFVVIALRVAGLPPGDYRVRLVLHDEIARGRGRPRSASAEAPLRIPKG